jgi:hypothetical protein
MRLVEVRINLPDTDQTSTLIKKKNKVNINGPIFHQIRAMINKEWVVHILHYCTQATNVLISLPIMVMRKLKGLFQFHNPPSGL